MRKFTNILLCAALILCLGLTAFAQDEGTEQDISFAAYCKSEEDISAAIAAGADYVSLADSVSLTAAAEALESSSAVLIIDADSIEDADEKLKETASLSQANKAVFRIKDGAKKSVGWAESNGVQLIGYYKGNIYPVAIAKISGYAQPVCRAIQMQTNNQDGVILHNSVTSFFEKHGIKGMFSFADSAKSAKRTDSARSWDDLIARGYDIIETAYPADFAEYLAQNTAEREKLSASVEAAVAVSTEGCKPNRVSTYENALADAKALLQDDSSATYAMADARAVLDEAVEKISLDDGSKVTGDFKITPARAAWALFGIALVLSWQIYFRKHWGKTN